MDIHDFPFSLNELCLEPTNNSMSSDNGLSLIEPYRLWKLLTTRDLEVDRTSLSRKYVCIAPGIVIGSHP
jgi:hypothetical protein